MGSNVPRRELRADTQALLKTVLNTLDNKKGEDVLVLQVGEISTLADLFVLVSGTNPRHCDTLVEAVIEAVGDTGIKPYGTEGSGTGWSLIDFGDVVVHVFEPAVREYYDIERLWMDAPRLGQTTGAQAAS